MGTSILASINILPFTIRTTRRLIRVRPLTRALKSKRYRYQIQFACFECRKAFKRPYTVGEQKRSAWLSRRISGRQPLKPFTPPVYHCPDCDAEATLMGRAFRAPRHDDVDRWRAVEILARGGITFWSYVGRLPETVSEAKRFVETHQRLSDGERLDRQIRSKVA